MDDDEMLVRSWNSTGYKGVYAQRTGGFRVEYGGRYVGYARSAREGAVKYAEAVAKAEAAKAEAMAKAARKAEAEAERAWDRVAEAEAILAKAKAKALDAEAETLKYKPAAEARKAHWPTLRFSLRGWLSSRRWREMGERERETQQTRQTPSD